MRHPLPCDAVTRAKMFCRKIFINLNRGSLGNVASSRRNVAQQSHFHNQLTSDQDDKHAQFAIEFQNNRIQISNFQRALLSVGSAVVSLLDPYRGDMISCLGETTGGNALVAMRRKMLESTEGEAILRDRPRINTKTVDFNSLAKLPENLLGRVYHDFMAANNITADSRLPVHFIEDVELGYVMQRYREVHDLVHTVLEMKTNMLGEVTVKWVEGIQTGLPMCVGGGLMGATRLGPKHRVLYKEHYLPWAIATGRNANFLQGIYFEKRWEQPLDDFHREMNIKPFNLPKNRVSTTPVSAEPPAD